MTNGKAIRGLGASLLMLLWAGSVQGQTSLYLRYGGGPKITVTGASNTTPIQIATSTAHGFNPGDVVWIWGADGNWNADGTRTVKAVQDATHFTIQYMNGSDAVGNGTFATASRIGAWCGSTVRYTLTTHPRLWFDGPNGSLTGRMKDPDGAGSQTAPRAQAGNPPWDAISSWLDGTIGSNYQWDGTNFRQFRLGSYSTIAAMALRWFGDNTKSTQHDGAIYWIQNAERIAESLACDESAAACGDGADIDYAAGYYVEPLTATYTLIHDQLAPADIAKFAGVMLNDNTDGATCAGMYQNGIGIVTTSTSAGIMTGSGTNWLSTLSAGDVIFPAGWNPWTIISVDSDTQVHFRTTNLTGYNLNGQSLTYKFAHPWATGNCGWANWAKHSGYSILSPYLQYPTQGGILMDDLFGNQILTKTAAFLNVGLATADDDPRGARLAEGAANWFQDVGFPLYQSYQTGPTQIDSQYGPDRFGTFTMDIVQGLYNSTGGAVNYLGGNWLKNRALFNIYEWLPTSDASIGRAYGIGYGTSNAALRTWTRTLDPAEFSQPYRNTPQGQYLNYFMRNVRGDFISSRIQSTSCYACPALYAFTDPTYTSTDYRSILPPSMAFIHTDAEATSPATNTSMIIDRTGFSSPNDTLLHVMAVDVQRDTNHLSSASTGTYNPASYSIYKNHQLLGEDSGAGLQTNAGYTNWDSKSMYMEVGGAVNLKDANGVSVISDVEVPRYADGGSGVNRGKYMYAMVDASGAYTAAAALTRLNRHFLDFKGGGVQYIVVYDDVQSTSGQMKRTFLHYPNNGQSGEGSTTYDQASNTVVSLDAPGQTALLTKVLFPGSPGLTYIDNSNGTYTGGVGQTFRVSVCAGTGSSAAGCDGANMQAEFLAVHMPTANQSDSLPAISVMTPVDPAFRGLEIGGVSPKVALFARNGVLNSGVSSFSTQQPGTIQFLVAGLAAGGYGVSKNGVQILPIQTVVDHDNSLYFESTSGSFAIVRQAPRPPLVIGAANLPPAYAGISYISHWAATGGNPPYSWSLITGSLPAGITIGADGVMSGTAASAGSSNFTVQVTDADGTSTAISSSLTVGTVTNTIGVKVIDISGSNGILRYGRDGLDANVSCTISVASNAGQQNPVLQFSDAGGSAWRRAVLNSGGGPLTLGTVYYVQALCGGEYGTAVFTTSPAQANQQASIRISMRGPRLAQSVDLEYGSTAVLGSLVSLPCASGCAVLLNAAPNTTLFMRRKYYDAGVRLIATSSIGTMLIP